jgi:hypothetical protein
MTSFPVFDTIGQRKGRFRMAIETALAGVSLLWAGMVMGISFLETPVKFRARTLTRPVALDVGRHVFGALGKVEMVWAAVGVGLLSRTPFPTFAILVFGLAALIVLLQAFWLRPLLDRRILLILDGTEPEPGPWHTLYIVMEVVKLISLLAAGLTVLQAPAH